MSNSVALKQLVDMANSGRKYPAMKLVGSNLNRAAFISKLVQDPRHRTFRMNDQSSYHNLDTHGFRNVSKDISEKMKAAENIMQLFPDLELAAQILISSILSPKDMVSTQVFYRFTESLLPASVSAQFLQIIEEEMEKTYQFKTQLPEILREGLFLSGAYVRAVIPEASVDNLINPDVGVSMESAVIQLRNIVSRNSIGILGNPSGETKRLTLESLAEMISKKGVSDYQANLHIVTDPTLKDAAESISQLVQITDNYEYLKLPNTLKALGEARAADMINNLGMESRDRFDSQRIEELFFRKPEVGEVPFQSVKDRDQTPRKSIGRPMHLKIPTEATIPVYVPGDPNTHRGYFLLLDEEGNFVTYNNSMSNIAGYSSGEISQNTNQVTNLLTSRAKNNLAGFDPTRSSFYMADYARMYKGIIEDDLIQRLKNGVYGQKLELGGTDHVYQMMLSRVLAGKFTRILYVPLTMITYFALSYNNDGCGKSMLDDLRMLTSLRAILMFAKVMAMAKNSINTTRVNMTLSPDDPDPMKTIEVGISEVMKARQSTFPLGINSPGDLMDWVQRVGVEFGFEGHPAIPETKFDFESKNANHQLPDNELDELLRKQTIMAFGLSPETVDNGFASEFATTVVANNILLSKRVLQWQDKIIPHMSNYVRQVVRNDFIIRDRLKDVIKSEKESIKRYLTEDQKTLLAADENKFLEYIIDYYGSYLTASLPRPDVTSISTQVSAFEEKEAALDKALDYWISSSFMTNELIGETSGAVDAVKAALKAYFMRQWMAENGFMSELADIVSTTDDDKPIIDLHEINKDHIEAVMRSVLSFIESLKNARAAGNTDMENMGVEGEGTMDSSDTSTSEEPTDSDSSSDDLGDLGDMGDTEIDDDQSVVE